MDPLVQMWLIHDRINRYVVENISDEAWALPTAKGKAVGSQFVHIHNVRRLWLKAISPDVFATVDKLEDKVSTREEVLAGLKVSASAVAQVVGEAVANKTRIKGFKPSTEAFVGYMISHESNHRAMAELSLRQAGHELNEKVAYGQWEWGTRFAELEAELPGG